MASTWMLMSLSSGNAIDSYSSWKNAVSAMRHIAETEPEALPELGLVEFDEEGMAVRTTPWQAFYLYTPKGRFAFKEARAAILAGDVDALAEQLMREIAQLRDEQK